MTCTRSRASSVTAATALCVQVGKPTTGRGSSDEAIQRNIYACVM
ncbi:unnamed protein product [Ectocarpus sp. 6 AP-2014]